jgi:hypothetical protein
MQHVYFTPHTRVPDDPNSTIWPSSRKRRKISGKIPACHTNSPVCAWSHQAQPMCGRALRSPNKDTKVAIAPVIRSRGPAWLASRIQGTRLTCGNPFSIMRPQRDCSVTACDTRPHDALTTLYCQ